MTITKATAEKVLKTIGKRFGADDVSAPVLIENWDGGYGARWSIVWEGGTYEWPHLLDGGFDEEFFHMIYPEFEPDREIARAKATRTAVELPDGIWTEAATHYAITLQEV